MEALFRELQATLSNGSILSSLAAIVLAYFGGVVSSFTPCVYPLIPITVGFIGGSNERTVREGFFLSLFYVLGLACVYTCLGIAASLSGKIFGTLTNSTGWYLVIGSIITLSALWMFEVIDFDPNVLMSKLSRKKHVGAQEKTTATLLGAFLFGSTSGFIASPCTTPALTVILSFVATEKSIAFGAVLMMAFALGMGTLLIFIGTFTGAMKVLPRSGKWLQTTKNISGYMLLALGTYFIYKAGTLR